MDTMAAWRILGSLAIVLVTAQLGRAQTYVLAESSKVGDCFRIQLEMKLSGEMRVAKDDKQLPLKLSASATHEYAERILGVAATGLPEKAARYYEESTRAVVTAVDDKSERKLAEDHRL